MRDWLTRFTRCNLPAQYRDTSTWRQVDPSLLGGEARTNFENWQHAVREYLAGVPLRSVCRACRVSTAGLLRRLNRALAPHPEGGIWGWAAFLAYVRIKPYTRLRAAATGVQGYAGAFRQFLADHPDIERALEEAILENKIPDAIGESRSVHRAIYSYFRRLCRRIELRETSYPLNTKDQGQRALRRYAREVRMAHFGKAAARLGGKNAGARARLGTGKRSHLITRVPFDLVSLDEHHLNLIGCVAVPLPDRILKVPIHRLILIPLIEHFSRAVIGYHIAIGTQAAALDVVQAVRNALGTWEPRDLKLPGFAYPSCAGLPSGMLSEAAGLCWNMLLIDNAMIHCAKVVTERMPARLGCAINWGPVRQWSRRPLIEALFSSLERRGFLRMPNTTGTGPADPLRTDAAAKAVQFSIMLEELLGLIDVVIATYNATPQGALQYRSPLGVLADALLSPTGLWLPRRLPLLPPAVPDFDVTVVACTVHGNLAEGRRPYIQTHCARYTSSVLASAADLIGQQLIIHVPESDPRTARAFFPNGSELGVLTAQGAWGQIPHDFRLRKAVEHAISERHIIVAPGEDPAQAFLVAKQQQVLREKARSNSGRPKILPSATPLARAIHVTGKTPPVADPLFPVSSRSDERPMEERLPVPSFVPEIRHRGVIENE